MIRIDNIKEKIKKGQPVIGTHVRWTDSNIAEMLAIGGFDFIWIDGEHGAMNIESVSNHLRAVQPHGAAAFYRIPWNDPVLAKPYLDMGVDAIIVPFVNTKADAELAVASCLYPPQGVRGYWPGRAANYGMMDMQEYYAQAKEVWTIVQVEHIRAVENLDAILGVAGIGAVIIGMNDLASSMGLLGKTTDPKVKETLDIAAKKCADAGVPYGTSCSYNEEIIADWVRRGANFISIGGDHDFIVEGSKRTIAGTTTLFAVK